MASTGSSETIIVSKWKLVWDYLWWKEKWSDETPFTQKDWNQTLLTRINQISAAMHMATLVGSANRITLNKKLFYILETLEYTIKQEDDTYKINKRYDIIFDNTLPLDKIYVSHEGFQNYDDKITPDMLVGEITVINI